MLEAHDITVKYGSRLAVSAVSLTLKPSEVTAIIGPNGAGKSTMLRTLNGALSPAAGRITLDARPLDSYSRRALAKRIAVVAQEADLRFPVTVFEFVLGGRYAWAMTAGWGWETSHDVEVARAVLGETQLEELSSRRMNELSGGERQRAVLARALATEAGVLLLDEPTANLDLAHQATILALVRKRCDTSGTSALVVTHDINLAAEFADHVLLMKDGKSIAFGRPDEVLTPELLKKVFDVRVLVDAHPITGVPRITPVHEALR
ncbi:MAG TPA: ABC transporter ATP-binding protein [Pyrinomonadaceae bacterium]|jgi:iron complex transport system ATP-binding protein|nr:ABC transporter ATP-binding protein [Pyrinomonadaceae bacterium]